MKKEDFQQKLEEAELLMSQGAFQDAVDIFDELNLNHVRQPKRLQNIARAYERCKRYEDAEDVLLEAKALAPKSRSTLFRLCTIAIKAKELEDAKDYYKDFLAVGGKDPQRFVLQYRLAEASKASAKKKIQILEAYKKEEPDDRWMYELALLYAIEGQNEEAATVCQEIALWFDNGKYVLAANELYEKLTGEELPQETEKTAPQKETVTQQEKVVEKVETTQKPAPVEQKTAYVAETPSMKEIRPTEENVTEDMGFTMEIGEEVSYTAKTITEENKKEEVTEKEIEVEKSTDLSFVIETAPEPKKNEATEHVVVNITEPTENKPSIRDMMNKVSEEASEPSEQDEEKKAEAPKEPLQKKEVHTEKAVKEDPSKKALPFVEEANNELEKQMKVRKEVQKDFYGIPYEPVVSVDTWHFLVSGTEEIFTLDCAKEIMRQVALENPNCPTKMLKISAQKIGNANIINSLDKFLGNMVIVEKAGSLSEKQLTDFSKVLDKDDRSLLVAFIDSKKELQKMLLTVPSLQHSFTAVFEGKCFEPEDLVQLAKEWLYNEDARMSQDAENACYDYASALLEVHYGSYRSEIIAYAERALRYGEKGGFLRLSAGKVDDDGFLILTEKHFRKAEKK